MQNTRTSKSLNAVIAQATFTATRLKATSSFEDILMLELISHHDTLCYQMLSSKLSSVQLQQVERQLRRIVSVPYNATEISLSGVTPETLYRDILTAIERRYPTADRISTLHALHYIVSDPSTATSRILTIMGLSIATLDEQIAEYSRANSISPIIRGVEIPTKVAPHPLAKFGVELTQMARDGKIDPVIGRDEETQRVVEILSRRKKNNPILVGEAGVGKSAIVEGLALRLVADDLPHTIQGKRLFSIDMAALVAGTKFRGEFEERMQQLLDALRQSRDTIVFIDEIHTIVGAGSTQGSLDTANILKPALARGEIQAIGATTFDEYRTHIESDSALERRLQRVVVKPTSVEQSIEILNHITPSYEKHHKVNYSSDAIVACVTLSDRYISDRHLPDKAIDLLDEAGARANIQNTQSNLIEREHIEAIITAQIGIPSERLSGNEALRLRQLESYLSARVIGQKAAVERVASTIRRSRSGITSADRPIGVFMLVGPTGVGKTLLAKELAEWMFGKRSGNLIRIDMSEYGQSHAISRLIGSPPGYVGYGEGGELSEAVRRNPYSVVLLDEIEKAHPNIFNLMLQIFDEGRLTDGAGRQIDLRNTIIIMTSNIGSRAIANRPAPMGYSTCSHSDRVVSSREDNYRTALEKHFTPEFLNRIDDMLIFRSLEREDMERIVELELEHIFGRTRSLGYNIRATRGALQELAVIGHKPQYGARALRRALLKRVEEPLSELIIGGKLTKGKSIVVEKDRAGEGVRLRVA